ncbi:MAG: glycine--tRNA ligase subunit beta [Desulfosalsimonadaceae bacterium]
MARLLVEIGTEEIPAGYMKPALEAFAENLQAHLGQNRIRHGPARVFGTPRRLAVIIDDVAWRQDPQTVEQTGPPEQIAFDADGRPTVAARKFAEKNQVSPDSLTVVETEKGRYAAFRRTDPGRATRTILRDALAGIILAIPFPKTMRWADLSIYFARPIHSLTALMDTQVISFSLGNVKSSRLSFGHRFLHPKKIRLDSAGDYPDALLPAWVVADPEKRRARMLEQMEEAVRSVEARVLSDPELVETVTYLVEYPATVLGSFDRRFLDIPREVLITAMREHQRYFAVVDDRQQVMPYFLAVNNTPARDMNLVKRGHERVLQARLEDARFFYRTDRKTSLDEMAEKLWGVLFQAELGSVYAKVCRIRNVAGRLAQEQHFDPEFAQNLDRAAWLSKADLVSLMVDEFPRLQGVMGRIYARASGEPEPVCLAIEEHYRPTVSGGLLPKSPAGALLAVSDKIDSICACFLVGLVPTGASDPYALRRQGIGLIQIILDQQFPLSIPGLVEASVSTFSDIRAAVSEKEAKSQAVAFLTARLANLLESEGIARDAVAAVLAVSENDPLPVAAAKARSLQRLKAEPEFESLAVGFKRVVNIIRKADSADTEQAEVSRSLFEYDAESALFDDFYSVAAQVRKSLAEGRIDQGFAAVATLRRSVDRFFEDVLVMTDNDRLRRNRLALLKQISQLFGLLADFSRIST